MGLTRFMPGSIRGQRADEGVRVPGKGVRVPCVGGPYPRADEGVRVPGMGVRVPEMDLLYVQSITTALGRLRKCRSTGRKFTSRRIRIKLS